MKKHVPFAFILLSSSIMFGCTIQHSLGDKMIAQAKNTQTLGESWNEGECKIKKGEKMIKKGESLIKKGHAMIADGKHLIQEGSKMEKESNKYFHEKFPDIDLEHPKK